ncbi:c-type cytochrome biogenesis protein CcmI [Alteromonas ponticola]|uniref:C-type cytochrome biogenesis protein CcmI n=1 Tax=Alteromonas ponticola TaxID=2720613 RepID=A0ABX1R236_9ALTE|nr:c-type cytochrome biogenesis protein CcmI [Alteromonas ponticola]NMH59308.1 c-type cytochrome biogenesis protein CcmI [Alteromonas ponticola]
MSWMTFIIATLLLTLLLVFLISLPWWRKNTTSPTESVNTKIVKQRLAEIEAEVEQGLISPQDSEQAINELKLALVDETNETQTTSIQTGLVLAVGAGLALLVGGTTYHYANQLSQVKLAKDAIDALPGLSEKLADGSASDFTPQDMTALTLAIRQRLRVDPTDVQGWMYLGRLWMAAGQQKQAIDSLEKATQVAPDNVMVNVAFAQMLTATGEATSLRKAQGILMQLIAQFPENDNFALLMAVASAQLGDMQNAKLHFNQIKAKLSPQSDIYKELVTRIEGADSSQTDNSTSKTGFALTIDIADGVADKIPEDGYLIVFAQDADSDNRMPAAVVKLPLSQFPRQLSLTNDNAMMSGYSLERLENVKLMARISADEDVMPTTGELEGQTIAEVINGSMIKLSITIDKELL